MTKHTDRIEAGIERERASLASTLGHLQDRVSVDELAREALDTIRANAAAGVRAVDQVVRSNPGAVALTGIGLAWLIFGTRKGGSSEAEVPHQAEDRWLDEGGALDPVEEGTFAPGSQVPHMSDDHADSDWAAEASRIRRQASDRLSKIEQDARSRTSDALGAARDFASERAQVVSEFTADLTKSFRRGLDDLSEAARDRIVSTRKAAYAAGLRAERLARRGSRAAGRVFDDHPLVVGAAALAAGAALAAFLPRTRAEDEAFGEERDRLMRQARALLTEERKRAGRVASGVVDELKSGAKELADAIGDEASHTVKAVKERAKEEAGKSESKKASDAAEPLTL